MGVAGGRAVESVVFASRDCDESFDKIPRVYTSARIEMNVAVFLIFTSQREVLRKALTGSKMSPSGKQNI